ncbi:uncharacterized protein LOC133506633 isoform X1 [Syngnathoides biaculeatus]|uniref:uncharacterized protein LOC133506633 isoform X1 n=1 Tax=Syngnathoides biaculeatus TaxID=300417 RepID=UPI002ADE6A0F|nr:uncharacterized protein LOC133506633 isoform X1 [Syngnathoides biaculeatus]
MGGRGVRRRARPPPRTPVWWPSRPPNARRPGGQVRRTTRTPSTRVPTGRFGRTTSVRNQTTKQEPGRGRQLLRTRTSHAVVARRPGTGRHRGLVRRQPWIGHQRGQVLKQLGALRSKEDDGEKDQSHDRHHHSHPEVSPAPGWLHRTPQLLLDRNVRRRQHHRHLLDSNVRRRRQCHLLLDRNVRRRRQCHLLLDRNVRRRWHHRHLLAGNIWTCPSPSEQEQGTTADRSPTKQERGATADRSPLVLQGTDKKRLWRRRHLLDSNVRQHQSTTERFWTSTRAVQKRAQQTAMRGAFTESDGGREDRVKSDSLGAVLEKVHNPGAELCVKTKVKQFSIQNVWFHGIKSRAVIDEEHLDI